MKLHFIPWIRLHFERLQQVSDIVLDQQRAAQDSHDLHDRPAQLEIMFNDSNETIGDDSNMNLYADGILRLTPECLDSEVLLNPFEEQLNLPSVLVQKCDVLGCEKEVVRVVRERPLQLRGIIDDTSERDGVIPFVPLSRETDGLVAEHIVGTVQEVIPVLNVIIGMTLFPNDEEGSTDMDLIESCKVKVPSVKHIASLRLVCKPVHRVDIVHIGVGDSVEYRYLRDDVNLCVDFDARLGLSELRPAENGQAEINGRGVHGIEPSMQLKLLCDALALCNGDHVECKLFKDAIVPESVSSGQHLPVDRQVSESKKESFLTMGECDICKLPEASASQKLAEHQDQQMVPMAQRPASGLVVVLGKDASELPLREKLCYLSKDILTYMHNGVGFEVAAKIAISKAGHDFHKLKYCA